MFQQLSLRILPRPRLLHFRILSISLSGPKVFLFQTSSYHPSMSHHPRETFPSCPTPLYTITLLGTTISGPGKVYSVNPITDSLIP